MQVFDPLTTNQAAPLVSVALSTNSAVPGSVWINDHAGSEGGGISRTTDRQFLALEGYTGTMALTPPATKPSADPTVHRGIVTLDAFTNAISVYSDLANWFGMPPGVSQNNPTGIASTDGTNFWGTGNVTGTSTEASGVLFYNADLNTGLPLEIENYIQAAAEARIIGGTLYVVVPGSGVYNFTDPNPPYEVIPLPGDPNSNPALQGVATNNFISWGGKFANIANFDMNPAGTIAYGADQTYGIVKLTNNAGAWVQAPYYYSATNIGTLSQPSANQGTFGICVDFSGTNPVVYATTMELGTTIPGNKQGNPNQNRLISIIDNGNPGTNLVAVTLATATTTNETFRGIDFTPDLRPLITTEPANVSNTNHGNATFALAVSSVYALNYQWLQATPSATNYLVSATNASLTLSNLSITLNGDVYQCVVSNLYGVVTSTPAILSVTTTAKPPVITNAVVYLTNYIGGSVTFAAVLPTGTQPFSYQWYQGGFALADNDVSDDGATYSGSTNNVLTITGLGAGESGNYYLAVTNEAGGIIQLVDVLSVQYQLPVLGISGQPQPVATFTGANITLTASPASGTQPFTNQWFFNGTPLTDPGPTGDDSGSYSTSTGTGYASTTLAINSVQTGDQGNYYVVISNGGGSVTSQVASVTVVIPPPHTYLAYSNQIYLQNFDSLPDPGANSVNSFNNGYVSGNIDGVAYSLANPFDFGYPVIPSSFLGGLGLANTMSGWYGAATTLAQDSTVSGYTRFGAQDGDQTTGGIIDFGPNDNSDIGLVGTNRALGLLSTGTTGSTTFGLKMVNESSVALNYLDVGFIGELWHNGTGTRVMSFGYTNAAGDFALDAGSISNATLVTNLAFSFPIAKTVTTVDGTQPVNQTNLSSANIPLVTPWQPGNALWLIWSINYYGAGSGNGYAIDNLKVLATANPLVAVSQPDVGGISYSSTAGVSLSFTNTAGAASQFTVWGTTNIALPLSQWQNLGSPTESPAGTYKFTAAPTPGQPRQFYLIEAISPSSF